MVLARLICGALVRSSVPCCDTCLLPQAPSFALLRAPACALMCRPHALPVLSYQAVVDTHTVLPPLVSHYCTSTNYLCSKIAFHKIFQVLSVLKVEFALVI